MRNISDVLNSVINAIPENFENKEYIKREFDTICYNATYTAPELMYLQWQFAYEILMEHCISSYPNEDWQWKVMSIFSTRTVDELKKFAEGE